MHEATGIINQVNLIDFDTIMLGISSICWTICIANQVKARYKINKNFRLRDTSKIIVPPELKQKYSCAEINRVAATQYKEQVAEFVSVVTEAFPVSSLVNFYNNFNELSIENNILALLRKSADGDYTCSLNKIRILNKSAIYHELFHMACSIYKDEQGYVGFKQFSLGANGYNIGTGMNEGYTEVITRRYFAEKHKLPKAYEYEASIMEKLEKIIGQEKMETLYLKSDLFGLVEELKKYIREEEIQVFISALDIISEYSDKIWPLKNSKLDLCAKVIHEVLFKTQLSKLKQEYDVGLIDKNTFEKQATEYIQYLGNRVTIGGRKYKVLPNETIEEYWSAVFAEPDVSDTQNKEDSIKR